MVAAPAVDNTRGCDGKTPQACQRVWGGIIDIDEQGGQSA